MNRRTFLTRITQAAIFIILPGAGRVWKCEKKLIYWSNEDLQRYNQFAFDFTKAQHFSFLPTMQDYLKKYSMNAKPFADNIVLPRYVNDKPRPMAAVLPGLGVRQSIH